MTPIFFLLSLLVLGFGFYMALRPGKNVSSVLTPYRKLMIFLFLAEVLYFVPYYVDYFLNAPFWELLASTGLLSIHHAIRLFVVGAEYEAVHTFALSRELIGDVYALYGAILYVASPAMTFGFILSFFQGMTSHVQLLLHKNRDLYIFSELNTRTLHLARSIRHKFPKAALLFCDVYRASNEEFSELETQARKLQAICFRKDIFSVTNTLPPSKGKLMLFIFGVNDNENISQASALLCASDSRKKEIYIRSYTGNYLFDDLPTPENVSVFRVDHIHSLVMRTISEHGPALMTSVHNHGIIAPQFNALVIGMGRYGSEMARALSWYTQVDGSVTNIHCFDRDTAAGDRFRYNYPGYFTEEPTTRYCRIHLHTGIPMDTVTMEKEISALKNIHYVFISLGDDDANIHAAYELRSLFARQGQHPVIHAIVYNSDKCNMLSHRRTHRGIDYDIRFFGAEEDLFSYAAVVEQEMKEQVREYDLQWQTDPRRADLTVRSHSRYNSSRSHLIHRALLESLSLDPEAVKRSEHCQWLNYCFSIGYRRSADGSFPDLMWLQKLPLQERLRILQINDLTRINPRLLDHDDFRMIMDELY